MIGVGLPLFAPYPFSGLTYRGHGKTFGDPFDNVNSRTLQYGTVLGGSAPVAGNLVVWIGTMYVEYYETGGSPNKFYRQPVGGGWVQTSNPTPLMTSAPGSLSNVITVMAKVIEATDLSSPAQWCTVQTNDTANAHAMWVAYTVSGTISSLTIPAIGRTVGNNSAPANVGVDSSALNAPAEAITFAVAWGTDGSIQLSGITLDFEETQTGYSGYFDANVESRVGFKKDVGGAAFTLSKGDDGSANGLAGGYVSVS